MQTFLPCASFIFSARCLDNQRLGKQRVEAWQIFLAATNPHYGWQNHPAVRMWRGYGLTLLRYGFEICKEWQARGFKDSLLEKFEHAIACGHEASIPPWLGDHDFHKAHRAVLLAKNYEWYKQFNWPEAPAEKVNGRWPYVWPVAIIKEVPMVHAT